ncbi:MAG: nicotinamide mononucleotide transporter [Bacteroidales bacterium]|jgi:nicotinamide mononucleotide transporter|nr:nicotinamide riboside transporter PnuC [Bacteroidales bacterium]NLK79168.1 nicotinamide mononucleotide transporter [Bacteroidales bacterium]HKM30530.1 nicotinamide riboside transporter PnuC [Bacteroidales bacterium]HPX79031.1 nicotinamide riboside transporter PnuC [Bacteroidales bacterium]HQB22916.1 nicotinamide riboside transporter PnuC [Bacteroidales bacterium]
MIEFLSLDNIFFTIGNQGISYLEFFGVLLGLTSVFLASLARAVNYWVGFVYAFVLFLMFLQKHLYTNMLLQPVSLGINIYGLYRWTRPGEGQKNSRNQLLTSFLSNRQRVRYVLLLVGFILFWGFFLTKLHLLWDVFPPARSPYLDASVAGLMLMAQILSAQKKWECWIFWILLNIGNVVMYILSGLVFMPIVAICFLVFNFVGLVHWKKEWEKHREIC